MCAMWCRFVCRHLMNKWGNEMKELNEFQKWCKEILPVVQAAADGYGTQSLCAGVWFDTNGDVKLLTSHIKYRIKPRTITVNGFEVPEPIRAKPSVGDEYFLASPSDVGMHYCTLWSDDEYENCRLSRGLCHATQEAAIAHAKAMLGIDPNSDSK